MHIYAFSRLRLNGDFSNIAVKANTVSSIVGMTADISSAAGLNATLGVWRDFSKVRIYSSGWSGSNQYVCNTFGIAKNIGYGTMGFGIASDFYLSSTINPQTGKPYQSWGETATNTGVTGISYWAGSKVGGKRGNALSLIIQLDYSFAKTYFKALQDHPSWATYKYRPR